MQRKILNVEPNDGIRRCVAFTVWTKEADDDSSETVRTLRKSC